MAKRRIWKSWYITSGDDVRNLQSAWQNCTGAFAKDKVIRFDRGWIETNLSLADIRSVARFACVRLSNDYVTDTKSSWDETEDQQ